MSPAAPHIRPRVARWGVAEVFAGASDDREISSLDEVADDELLLVGAPLATDHARELRRLRRRRDGLAVVVAGRAGTRRVPGDLGLLLGADAPAIARAGELGLLPEVDRRRDNPVGWRRWARHPAVAVLTNVPDAARLRGLGDAALDVRILLAGDVRATDLPDEVAARVASRVRDADDLADRLRRFRVLVDDPAWHEDATVSLRVQLRSLALGTPVVTSDGRLDRLGLPGTVARDEMVTRARALIDDDVLRERISVVGRRRVLADHDGAARLGTVLEALGRPAPAPPRISVLLATNRPDNLAHAVANVARQRHPDVELVAVLHGEGFDHPAPLESFDGPVRVVRAAGDKVLGECLNLGLAEASGELVTKMDDDDHYGRDHLGDLALALDYSGAALAGKRIEHIHLADRGVTVTREQSNVERFRGHVSGPTLLASRALLERHPFSEVPRRVDSTLLMRLADAGQSIYGTHALDVVLERRGQGHTWDADTDDMLERAAAVTDGLDLDRTASEPDAFRS